jgi:hypothetical protein
MTRRRTEFADGWELYRRDSCETEEEHRMAEYKAVKSVLRSRGPEVDDRIRLKYFMADARMEEARWKV